MAEIQNNTGGIEAILAESEVGRVLLDAVTGRTKYHISDNGEVNNAITGKTEFIYNGDIGGASGGIDVSATTATAADVRKGKQFFNAAGELTQGTNTADTELAALQTNYNNLQSNYSALQDNYNAVQNNHATEINNINSLLDTINGEVI